MFENVGDDGARTAPSEFCVFRAGTTHTDKGDFLFDDEAAELVLSAYRLKGVPLMGDYEHQTLAQPPIEAPASITEWVPEIRRNRAGGPELWATQVKWTERAKAYLTAGEYRMFSPAFLFDDKGRVTRLVNIALTNNPATHGQEPLVAATAGTERNDTMACELCGRTEAKMTAMADEHRAHLKGLVEEHTRKIGELTAKLESFEQWAAEEEKEHGGNLTALSSFHKEIATLTGQKTLAGSLGVLRAFKQGHEEATTLKATAAEAKAAALKTEFESTLDRAVTDGKIPPAQKPFWSDQAKQHGHEQGLAALKSFVAVATPAVATSAQLPGQDSGSPLTPALDQMGRLFGTTNNKRVNELIAQQLQARR